MTRALRGLVLVGATLAAGPVASYERLDFDVDGGGEDLAETLRGTLLLDDLDAEEQADGNAVLAAANADYTRLLEALYAQGRYGAAISIRLDGREAARIPPLDAPDRVEVVQIAVDPGPRFRLGEVAIGPLAPDSPLPAEVAPGQPAEATAVRNAAQDAVRAWREAGHAKARIAEQDITARHEARRLDVTVRIDPGPRLRFGDVDIAGESAVSARRARQIAGIPRGEPFDPASVEKAAERLRRTGTFRSVTIEEAETPNADGSLDLEITLVDRPTRRLGFGAEIATGEGLSLTAFLLNRNLLGGAERLRFDGAVTQLFGTGDGGTDYRLNLRFERGAVYGPDTLFFIDGLLEYEDEPDFVNNTARLAFGATREFSDSLTGELAIQIRYSRITERFRGELPGGGFPQRDFTLIGVPASLAWDRRDVPADATRGFYLGLGATPFTLVGDGVNGLQMTADARVYRALGERAVIAGRLQLGALAGPDAQDAPPDYLFYSGGGGTVRGQPFESLGADYNGERLGGRSFVAVSGEIRVDVTERIGVVGFADAGYVGTEPTGGDGDWHAGAGLGLRYDTTIGPIRLDVAGPVAGDTGEGVQLYLGIGQAF